MERVNYALSLPRDLSHPFTHVFFEVDNHTHIYAAGGGELIEEMAAGLAEAVERCGNSEGLHLDQIGRTHGVQHPPEAPESAYKAAVDQLLTRDYYEEFLDLQRKIEHHDIWGGPVPSLVFQPKPGESAWQASVTHPVTGLPHFYDIPESLLEIPRPDPKYYHEGQLGYYYKGNNNRSRLPVRR